MSFNAIRENKILAKISEFTVYHSCPPVREIILLLKLVDYLHVQADKRYGITIIHSGPSNINQILIFYVMKLSG